MKTPKQWLEQRCHSLKGVTEETIQEIQEDARQFPPLPESMGLRITRIDAIESLKNIYTTMVKLIRLEDPAFRGYPDTEKLLAYIEEHGLPARTTPNPKPPTKK